MLSGVLKMPGSERINSCDKTVLVQGNFNGLNYLINSMCLLDSGPIDAIHPCGCVVFFFISKMGRLLDSVLAVRSEMFDHDSLRFCNFTRPLPLNMIHKASIKHSNLETPATANHFLGWTAPLSPQVSPSYLAAFYQQQNLFIRNLIQSSERAVEAHRRYLYNNYCRQMLLCAYF